MIATDFNLAYIPHPSGPECTIKILLRNAMLAHHLVELLSAVGYDERWRGE